REAAIEGAVGELTLFGTVGADHDKPLGLAFSIFENCPVSEDNPLSIRRPCRRESSSAVLLEELLAVGAVQIAHVNGNLIEGDNSERTDIPKGAEGQFPGARNRGEFARESEVERLILGKERLVLLRIVGELLIDQLLAVGRPCRIAYLSWIRAWSRAWSRPVSSMLSRRKGQLSLLPGSFYEIADSIGTQKLRRDFQAGAGGALHSAARGD